MFNQYAASCPPSGSVASVGLELPEAASASFVTLDMLVQGDVTAEEESQCLTFLDSCDSHWHSILPLCQLRGSVGRQR